MGSARATVCRLIIWLLAGIAVTSGQEVTNASITSDQQQLNETSLLGLDFTQIKAPIPPDGSPVSVEVSIYIIDVKIDENAQVIQFDCYLRTIWQDHRINMPDVDLLQIDTAVLAKIWVPDVFFVNAQRVSRPKLLPDASGIILYRNKTIVHSSLYLTQCTCYLNYENYPMDRHACNLRLEAYMYSDKVMVLRWHHTGITWGRDIRLKSFIIRDIRPLKTVYETTFTGVNSAISFEVLLERKVRNSMLSVFVPSSMLIFVSWLSLWEGPACFIPWLDSAKRYPTAPLSPTPTNCIKMSPHLGRMRPRLSGPTGPSTRTPAGPADPGSLPLLWVPPKLVPGRMVLVITTLLTLTALFNASVQNIPEVSYVKALDVWILTCIVFVFFTIVEYIVVLRLFHGDAGAKIAPQQHDKAAWTQRQAWTGKQKADLLEKVARTLLPLAFLIFNIAYWAYYLSEDVN